MNFYQRYLKIKQYLSLSKKEYFKIWYTKSTIFASLLCNNIVSTVLFGELVINVDNSVFNCSDFSVDSRDVELCSVVLISIVDLSKAEILDTGKNTRKGIRKIGFYFYICFKVVIKQEYTNRVWHTLQFMD